MMKKKIFLYPITVIIICFAIAMVLTPIIKEWTFIPLTICYWIITFTIIVKTVGFKAIRKMFQKSTGRKGWNILTLFAGILPLPILLMNLSLLTFDCVFILWLLFALINPFFEEIFWRGFLIDNMPIPKWKACLYSTFLFVISHPIMWGASLSQTEAG